MNAKSVGHAPSERNIDPHSLVLDKIAREYPIISTHFGMDTTYADRTLLEASANEAAA